MAVNGKPSQDHMVICFPFPNDFGMVKKCEDLYPDLKVTFLSSSTGIDMNSIPWEDYSDMTILFTYERTLPMPGQCPHLDLVHFIHAGTDHVQDHPLLTETIVTVTCTTGIHGPQIAEVVFMTALFHSRSMNEHWENQQKKLWPKMSYASKAIQVRDLYGQRLAVLGYGSIGRQGMRKRLFHERHD